MTIHKAVMVGCGAMSGCWLDESSKIPNLSVVGLVDIDLKRPKTAPRNFISIRRLSAQI